MTVVFTVSWAPAVFIFLDPWLNVPCVGVSVTNSQRDPCCFPVFGSLTLFCHLSWKWSWKIYPLIFFFPLHFIKTEWNNTWPPSPPSPPYIPPENEGSVEEQVHPQQNAKENTRPGSAEAARAAELSVAEGKCHGLKEPESIQKTTRQSGTRGPSERGWASDSGTNWKLKEWETLRDCHLFVRCFRGPLRLQT